MKHGGGEWGVFNVSVISSASEDICCDFSFVLILSLCDLFIGWKC